MERQIISGHIAAIITITIWSTTYIATKVLLNDFTPIEILLIRFSIGFLTLKLLWPKGIGFNIKQEPYYILAGLTGVCLYFLVENIALTKTTACNVGIILAITPLFTAIATKIFYPQEKKLSLGFYIGFLASFIGILILSLKGSEIAINPVGDLLAVFAGIIWSIYSVLTKKINNFGFNAIQVTRRTFLYGLIFIIPISLCYGINTDIEKLTKTENIFNLLFLGVGASAICFASWNFAVKAIGAVSTIIYLYATPSITIIFAYLILDEKLTMAGIVGCILITIGLVISQGFFQLGYKYITTKYCTKNKQK
jgi:drug/metabolite transporter (DMT)-like permease